MKNTLRKMMAAAMVIVLLLGELVVSSRDAQALSQNHMKKLRVQWDLKKGKKVVCDALFADVGMKKRSVTYQITKFKVSNAGKKGYKKLTLTCVNSVTY